MFLRNERTKGQEKNFKKVEKNSWQIAQSVLKYKCQKEKKRTQNLCQAPSKKVKKILKNLLTKHKKCAII